VSLRREERKGDYRGEGREREKHPRGGGESPDGRCGESRNVEEVERT